MPVAHSIPEANALAIRTPAGLVVHTGDWKLDPTPFLGGATSETAFRALGDEGVLALVCDSTNIVRDGASPSESEVAASLKVLIAEAPHRVAVTTFASNVARIRAVAEAAHACGREVVVVGRAMDRVVDVATECGYLSGLPEFNPPQAFGYLARDKVVALLTGSQGEPRAALARIAEDQHPDIALSAGDRLILSSRTIPGNETPVNRIVNALVRQGIEVVSDRTHLVHVSGHPRRGEVARMYEWVRPRIAIPAHGEDLHLAEHAAFARAQGVERVVSARNGTLVRLAPGPGEIVDHVPAGRLFRDGEIVVGAADRGVPQRRRLAFSGIVSVAVAIDKSGDLVGHPVVEQMGLPDRTRSGRADERHRRRCRKRGAGEPAARAPPRSRHGRAGRLSSGAGHRAHPLGKETRLSRAGDRGVEPPPEYPGGKPDPRGCRADTASRTGPEIREDDER